MLLSAMQQPLQHLMPILPKERLLGSLETHVGLL